LVAVRQVLFLQAESAMRLERSCDARRSRDWLATEAPAYGVARLRARLQRQAYATHRHDTYTVAMTECGVQEFDYRGGVHRSRAGQVVLLHPDEPHNGRAGTPDGFGYRTLYVEPALLFDAVQAIDKHARALPFVPQPVRDDADLAAVLRGAFDGAIEPLRAQAIVWGVARALCRAARRDAGAARSIDAAALRRAREYLDVHNARVVRAGELEAVSGLSRFELCAQFKCRFGTTPYRYLLMRRLDAVRARLPRGERLSAVASDCGFADQAHMTRVFKAAVGFTPRQFALLHRTPQDLAR
jgi:AraC-like DNA-binding protein